MKITLIRKEGEVADCVSSPTPLHKGAFFQFLFRWIHYCHRKENWQNAPLCTVQTLVVLLGDSSNYYCCLQPQRSFKMYKSKV